MKFTQESVERFAREIDEQGYTVIEDALDPKFHRDLADAVTRIEKIAEDQNYGTTNEGRMLPFENFELWMSPELVNEFSPKLRELCYLN